MQKQTFLFQLHCNSDEGKFFMGSTEFDNNFHNEANTSLITKIPLVFFGTFSVCVDRNAKSTICCHIK